MEKKTTAERLKELMTERNLRQIDILHLTEPYCLEYRVKLNKSDLSQYCSGKTVPNRDKLFVLSSALQVSEAWLLGFDVAPERETDFDSWIQQYNETHEQVLLTEDEYELLDSFRRTSPESKRQFLRLISYYTKLSALGKKKVLDHTEDLSKLYTDEVHTTPIEKSK